jgi:hypothetical protein
MSGKKIEGTMPRDAPEDRQSSTVAPNGADKGVTDKAAEVKGTSLNGVNLSSQLLCQQAFTVD